jgi:amino acid transporter
VLGAVAAYVAYLAASVINQNEAATTQWAKIQIVTLANVAFVFLVVTNLVRLRRASTEESRLRRQELGRSVNVLAIISIGLSLYFFGKDVLRDLDLPELRPMMMSVFVQALALLAVHAQLGSQVPPSDRGPT